MTKSKGIYSIIMIIYNNHNIYYNYFIEEKSLEKGKVRERVMVVKRRPIKLHYYYYYLGTKEQMESETIDKNDHVAEVTKSKLRYMYLQYYYLAFSIIIMIILICCVIDDLMNYHNNIHYNNLL